MKKTISRIMTVMAVIAAIAACSGPEPEPTPTPSPTPVNPTPNNPNPSTPTTVSVTGVKLDKSSISLVEGGSETLTATVSPDNATNKAISWKSSDTGVATVDGNGKVTAVKAGSSTITVTTTDGSKTATCTVTVTAKTVSVTGVKLDKAELELVEGDDAQLTATVSPEDASDKSVSWKSSDTGVATVDESGKVTAVKAGSATITVTTTDGSKTADCNVTVTAKEIVVEEVKIEPATLEITEGETAQLKALVSPADADQEVEWTSTDKQVLTVDQNGLVTAIKPGTAIVVIRSKSYNDKQGACEVTVNQDKSLKGISLDATEITLNSGESRTLGVVYTPNYAANKNVTWSSSDPSVATVTEGKVTALKEGTATVTAVSEEGGFKAECNVTVAKAERPFLYIGVGEEFLINGVPDPLDGSFDDEKKEYSGIGFFDSDGKDLYSLEMYNYPEYLWTGTLNDRYHAWICKNRKPIKDVSKYYKYDASYVYTPQGFSQRNGVYAIGIQEYQVNEVKVIRYQESDGDLVEYTIKSPGTKFESPRVVVGPNGVIHAVMRIKDSFNKYYIAWFQIDKGGNMTSKLIENDGDPTIDVTSSGDLYILTRRAVGNYYDCLLFKNGSLFKTVDKVDINFQGSVKCVGNSVYTIVNDVSKREARIHKDGTKIKTVTFNKDTYLGSLLWVTSGGDTYFAAGDDDIVHLYKNGNILYTYHDSIWGLCVLE